MERHELDIYVELYKRGDYESIPLGAYPNGEYFYMTPKQVETCRLMNDSITTLIGYGGSARSGKTIIEVTIIILDCLAYPGIAWGLSRKELTTLKRTILLTFFIQIQFYGISENEYNYNSQLNKITFLNKSDIFLIDTAYKPSDPLNTRFGGFELTRCAIDESNETQISVVNKLFERTGWRNNEKYKLKRKLFECFNPATNHVYTRYYLPYRDKKEPIHKRFIAALPTDNPNPAVQEWIEDLLKTGDQVTIERQIYGNFEYDDDPSSLVDYDAICDIFTNDHVPEGNKSISSDLAMQGRDRFVTGLWRGLRCTIAIDEEKSTGRSIELGLDELKNNNGIGNSQIVADGDGLGNYLESYIKNIVTFRGGGRPKNKKDYNNIKSECAWYLANKINSRELYIKCSPDQEAEIKKELSICLKKDNLDKDLSKKQLIPKSLMKEKLGHSPDYLDMLIMGMLLHVKGKRRQTK